MKVRYSSASAARSPRRFFGAAVTTAGLSQLALFLIVLSAATPAAAAPPAQVDPPSIGPSSDDASSADAATSAPNTALHIRAGAIASSQVVGLGRDVVVEGRALADVAAIGGAVRVTGEVVGDVIVLDGDVHLGADATVGGDVVVFGGALVVEPQATIGGRSLSYPTLSGAWLQLLEGPALHHSPLSPTVLLAKISLLMAWLVLVVVLFQLEPRGLLRTAAVAADEPARSFWTGLVAVLTLTLTGVAIAAVAGHLVALPLLILVVVGLLVLKFWGMVAVFFAFGSWVGRRFGQRWAPLSAASVGLLLLGVVKLVPVAGGLLWTLATFIAVGAAARTRLGRVDPWLEPELPDPRRFPRPF